jgi:hypothetical protein
MSQLTIYLDEESLSRVKTAAERERLSVSKWARQKLTEAANRAWPEDYFELFGALRDTEFERPDQGAFDDDAARKEL